MYEWKEREDDKGQIDRYRDRKREREREEWKRIVEGSW